MNKIKMISGHSKALRAEATTHPSEGREPIHREARE